MTVMQPAVKSVHTHTFAFAEHDVAPLTFQWCDIPCRTPHPNYMGFLTNACDEGCKTMLEYEIINTVISL